MQLEIMPKKKSVSAGRVPLILFLCQMISALDVPLDCKYEHFKAFRPGRQHLPSIYRYSELCE